jgi:hypothetical protein
VIRSEEVREIQAAAHGVVPGALVNISGVVTGCPCEDGTGWSDQVWIVAYRSAEMKRIAAVQNRRPLDHRSRAAMVVATDAYY